METTLEEAIASLEEDIKSLNDSLLLLKLVLDKNKGTTIINQEVTAKILAASDIRF